MTVRLRRAADRPATPAVVHVEPRLGIACEHCTRAIGQDWHNGKVRLPVASFAREDGRIEARCPHCTRYTTLPYQRVAQ